MPEGGGCGYSFMAKALGVLTSLVMFIGGILTMITISGICFGVGVYMLVSAFVVGLFEAPSFYGLFNCSKDIVTKVKDSRFQYPGYKAMLYMSLAIFMWFCASASSIICGLLIFGTGFLNFLVWLENSRQTPYKAAPTSDGSSQHDGTQLVGSEPVVHDELDIESRPAVTTAPKPEEPYPWEKFMTAATNQVGAAVGKAVVASMFNPTPASSESAPKPFTGAVPSNLTAQ